MVASIRAFIWKLAHIFRRQKSDDLISDELDLHVQMETEENIRQGMNPEEARRCALIALGGIERTREEYRETCAIRWAA